MPKTIRNEFYKYLSYDKLMEAHLKCQKGKKNRINVIKFNVKKEEYVQWLYEQIKNKKYKQGKYTTFYVREPKKRKIEAARYMDRVVHRWIFDNFLEPAFLPQMIDTTYACIKGRGMHKAALDVQNAMKKCQKEFGSYYILKMDVAKYFQSIDKDILMNIIKRKIKDLDLLELINQTIYYGRDESGIPIGNLSSQLFANLYYNEADQFIKHKLKIRYYFRYMDDSIILLKNKEELKEVKRKIEEFIWEKLHLKFNNKTNIFKNKQGVNFCGYKINEYRMKIRDKGKRRIKKNIKKLKIKIKNGEISSKDAKRYLCGHFGYIKYANTYNFIRNNFAIDEEKIM
ncbi:MAG: reverse transcriptase/maturase family protein [Clostridia bacterium]|nr:reverse transcriptase/maturase family protein [Clostridia bacterium]